MFRTVFISALFVLALLCRLGVGKAEVGRATSPVGMAKDGSVVAPDNHILTPAGKQVLLPALRPQALALSPDGKLLAVSGHTPEVVLIDPDNGDVLQRVALPPESDIDPAQPPVSPNILKPDERGQVSFTGMVFSPDGRRLYLSNVNGSIKVFSVGEDRKMAAHFTLALPPANAPLRKEEIPSGLALTKDGALLYVAMNLSNTVAEVETATGRVRRTWKTGFAPYDVLLAGSKLYVSNWGGRQPAPGDPVAHAGRGTKAAIDPRTGVVREGSVTVIDLEKNAVLSEIITGRHASGMALTPDGRHLAVACAADDFIAIISTQTDQIVSKIWPKRTPADLFGAAPNALAFSPDGKMLYVCNGTQNAVAVVEFSPDKSELEGLIPTGWYPGAIVYDAPRRQLMVANVKGIGSGLPPEAGRKHAGKSNNYQGTVSLIPLPNKKALEAHTGKVLANNRTPLLEQAFAKPRADAKPRPVPERVGEPSVFKHVLYIIKENRTYDQVLGDMPEGNGNAGLCIFGEDVTPNQHKISRDFVLLDNTYCSGVLSADGHNWSCSAITTDYVEKQFAGFPRSYPDGSSPTEVDALAWSPAGFIWDAARAKKLTVRLYGEFGGTDLRWLDPARPNKPSWSDVYADWKNKTGAIYTGSHSTLPSNASDYCAAFPAWDLNIPDQIRADVFLKELKAWEENGAMPALMIMSLPLDHTAAAEPGRPTPRSMVADHDIAFARIVEALSRSRFWKDTVILAIEDDPQDGWDHVSAYRTIGFCASAWTKRGAVISTQYNQTSLLRTIELILGIPSMNELDAVATPMSDCFADIPNFTPWASVPSRIPFDTLNKPTAQLTHPKLREDAEVSSRLPLDKLDACPEAVLNGILWRSTKGPDAPFPSWAVAETEEAEREER